MLKGILEMVVPKHNGLNVSSRPLWSKLLWVVKTNGKDISVAPSEKQSLVSDGKPGFDSRVIKQKEGW